MKIYNLKTTLEEFMPIPKPLLSTFTINAFTVNIYSKCMFSRASVTVVVIPVKFKPIVAYKFVFLSIISI